MTDFFRKVIEPRSDDPAGLAAALVEETVKYRDELKARTGTVLTVSDTQVALDALKGHMDGERVKGGLTTIQQGLLDRWLLRIIGLRNRK